MPSAPRVARVVQPREYTQAPEPIPVWLVLRNAVLGESLVQGLACAWSSEAVLVEWEWANAPGGAVARRDWFDARDVHRERPAGWG